jgi:very-short-patch-repair endonuclease
MGLTTVAKLRRYIRERNLQHRPGMKTLRRLLDDRTKGVPQKELEKLFLRKLRATALPEPVRQQPCGRFFIDFAYPEHRIAIELYGKAWHADGKAFREDPRRMNEIVLAGWRKPLVFTWEDVDERWRAVEATIRRALAD